MAWNKISQVYTLSDIHFYPGSTHIPMASMLTKDRIESLKILLNISQEKYYLFINWDSIVCSPAKWQDQFMAYDYIGTPLWIDENAYLPGSQNFSIFSRNLLMEFVTLFGIRHDGNWTNHEVYMHSNHFLKLGFNLAHHSESKHFSYESGPILDQTFGVSGSANFPLFLNESELLPNANEFNSRQSNPSALLNYLKYSIETGKFELFKTSVENLVNKPNLKKAIQFELLINPLSELPKIIQSFNSGKNLYL